MIRAALHLHSTWSDGEWTVAQLREAFARTGCRVIGVVDHAESFDGQRLQRFAAECASLSDDRLLVLPGLEFECRNRLHIVGYGVTTRHPSEEPAAIIRHIADLGGVSVIAHPKSEYFSWIADLAALPHGIEAWNSKYDGRRAPRPETFALIRSLNGGGHGVHAFYGTDLHWRHQYRDLHTEIDLPSAAVTVDGVLDALRAGRFRGVTDGFSLPSTGELSSEQEERFGRLYRRGRRLRAAVGRVKGFADALGVRPPAGLKAQLRRLF